MTMIHQALLSHTASCGEDQIHRIFIRYLMIIVTTELSSSLMGLFRESETNDFKWSITRLKILTGRRRSSWLLADKCSYQSMKASGLQVQGSKRSDTQPL